MLSIHFDLLHHSFVEHSNAQFITREKKSLCNETKQNKMPIPPDGKCFISTPFMVIISENKSKHTRTH